MTKDVVCEHGIESSVRTVIVVLGKLKQKQLAHIVGRLISMLCPHTITQRKSNMIVGSRYKEGLRRHAAIKQDHSHIQPASLIKSRCKGEGNAASKRVTQQVPTGV